eukprot:995623-Pleurochrysis_carterae.AAC.1
MHPCCLLSKVLRAQSAKGSLRVSHGRGGPGAARKGACRREALQVLSFLVHQSFHDCGEQGLYETAYATSMWIAVVSPLLPMPLSACLMACTVRRVASEVDRGRIPALSS